MCGQWWFQVSTTRSHTKLILITILWKTGSVSVHVSFLCLGSTQHQCTKFLIKYSHTSTANLLSSGISNNVATYSAVMRQQLVHSSSLSYPNTQHHLLSEPSDLKWESTMLRDQPSSKAHVGAVDKRAGISLTVNHTEIDCVTSCCLARVHFFHCPTHKQQ